MENDTATIATRLLADRLIGMEADEARTLVEQAGREWTVVPTEGRTAVHGDLRPLRILVQVRDGKITWSRGG